MMEDPQSPKWMVFLSEWLAIIAKRLIWSTYDGRLYVLLTAVTEWLRCLDLARVLGSAVLQERLQALLHLHERVDWYRVPYKQGHHFDNPRVKNHSPGRRFDASTPLTGNWVRIATGTLSVTQPELLLGQPGPATGVSGEAVRVRPREEILEVDSEPRAREPVRVRAKRGGVGSSVDMVMAEGTVVATREASSAGPELAEVTDASLRALFQNPRMRSKLRQLFAEGGSGEGTTVAKVVCTPPSVPLGKEISPRPKSGVQSTPVGGSEGTTPVEGEGGGAPGEPHEEAPEEQVSDYVE